MNIYEFAEKLSAIQKFAVPSYLEDAQEFSRRFHSQHAAAMLIAKQFQQNYQSLEKIFLPYDLPAPLGGYMPQEIPFINQIVDKLNSTIQELSAFEFHIEEFAEEKQDEKQIITLVDNTKIILKNIYEENKLIDKVDPRDFEKIVAELLHNKGYEVQLTKQTRDGGYDILALKKIDGFPFKILAECKRHKKTIGIEIIRSFCDVINQENASKGVIFTTSYYSPDAIKRQIKMGTLLDLRNRDDLIEWIIKYHEK
jgi:HJR/Mrr/RecB family endonuclease